MSGTCRVYSLKGTEEEAQLFAEAELQRIAQELDKEDESSSDTKLSKAFTAYLPRTGRSFMLQPSDYIPVHFPWDDEKALAAATTREVEDLYTTSGDARLDTLLAAIAMSAERYVWDLGADGPFKNVVAFTASTDARKAGDNVSAACRKAVEEVRKRAAEAVKEVADEAIKVAKARLRSARDEIVAEAPRYLALAGRHGAAGDEIVTGSHTGAEVILRGPALADLVDALRDLHERRRAVEATAADFRAKEAEIRESRTGMGGDMDPPPYAQSMFADVTPQEMAHKYPAAAEALQEAAGDLALALTVYSVSLPVIGRIWTRFDLPRDVEVVRAASEATLLAHTVVGGAAIEHLKEAILQTLRATWKANIDFEAKLSPAVVWRYSPVIESAVDVLKAAAPASLKYHDPSVELGAVKERLERETEGSLIAKLAQANGVLAVVAAVLLAIPVLDAALAIVAFVLGTGLAAETFEDYLLQEDAFKAVLDPNKALAAEPDAEGLFTSLAFVLLDLKGMRDAVRAAALAREAAIAGRALEAAGGTVL